MNNNKIIYIAGGGGMPAAIIHAGILWNLKQKNLDCDTYVGTSAGSITSSFFAVKKEHDEPITKKVMDKLIYKNFIDLLDLNMFGVFKFYMKKLILKNDPSLIGKWKGNKLEKYFNEITKNMKFKDLTKTRLYITATELFTGQLIIFSKETTPEVKLSEAIRASCSIQGVFVPKMIEYDKVKNGIFVRNSINKPFNKYKNIINLKTKDLIYKKNDKKYILLVDGGNLGNCRIDIGSNIKNDDEMLIATSFTQMNKHPQIRQITSLIPHTIKIMMSATEKLIIKYAELKYNKNLNILRPNTYKVNTIDFKLHNNIKKKLFEEGIKCSNKIL